MEEIKNKDEAIQFLYSLKNHEINRFVSYNNRNYNQSYIDQFLKQLDYPQSKFKVIHIAGTNGKGSLAFLLSHLLTSKDFKTGVYTSPHLLDPCERIRINHKPINDLQLVSLTRKLTLIQSAISVEPSFFDAMTAISILAFHESKCDYVILETGLGGRLDSTNFASSKITVINTISYDHTELLGDTLTKIAYEKAGIIQEGNQLILGKQNNSLYPVFEEISKLKQATSYQYQKDFFVKELSIVNNGIEFTFISNETNHSTKVHLPLLSIHQSLNTALALFTLNILKISFTDSEIKDILKSFRLPGRFQKISDNPAIILDGAHNPHAIQALKINLVLRYKEMPKKILILGVVKGKDHHTILKTLIPFFDHIIITKLSSFQEDASFPLFIEAQKKHSSVAYAFSFHEAYILAQKLLHESKEALLVITGSYYLLGEAISFLRQDQHSDFNL